MECNNLLQSFQPHFWCFLVIMNVWIITFSVVLLHLAVYMQICLLTLLDERADINITIPTLNDLIYNGNACPLVIRGHLNVNNMLSKGPRPGKHKEKQIQYLVLCEEFDSKGMCVEKLCTWTSTYNFHCQNVQHTTYAWTHRVRIS